MKLCRSCGTEKPHTEFSKATREKDGLQYRCKACNRVYRIENSEKISVDRRIYYEANREKILEQSKYRYQSLELTQDQLDARRAASLAWYKNNPEKANKCRKAWIDANPDQVREYQKKWAELNPEKVEEKSRKYRENNRHEMRARSAKWYSNNKDWSAEKNRRRYAIKINATPIWADRDQIMAAYRMAQELTNETGIEHHVDHIVPLKSRIVCGLHCEANLQVIHGLENIRKGNRHWPDMP